MESQDKKIEENKMVEEMYTTLSEAKEEIWRRWNDKELRKKVEEYLGEIPEVLKKEPKAVLARHISTPNKEFCHFHDLANIAGLKPLVWEYLDDKFFTVNQDKLCLGKIHFYTNGENGNTSVATKKVIDFKNIEGEPIKNIQTKWGKNLVEFHKEMLCCLGFKNVKSFDASNWYHSKGNNAEENYKYFLSLFIQNGILFENFLVNENEENFTKRVVLPACRDVEKFFGVKPLIVPISSQKDETELFWWCYPSSLEKEINKYI